MSINITVQQVKPMYNDLPKGITWLFYGQPKVGKTTVTASFSPKGRDGVLLIDTDFGADFVECNRIIVGMINPPYRHSKSKVPISAKDYSVLNDVQKLDYEVIPPDLRNIYVRTGDPVPVYAMNEVFSWIKNQLETNKFPYDTVVIDTVNRINEWIEEIVCAELGIRAMGEATYGNDWALSKKYLLTIIKSLQMLLRKYGRSFVMTCHAKPSVVVDNKIQQTLELPKGITQGVISQADVIGYVYIPAGAKKPCVQFAGYDEKQMGSRIKALAGKTLNFDFQSILNEITNYKEKEN